MRSVIAKVFILLGGLAVSSGGSATNRVVTYVATPDVSMANDRLRALERRLHVYLDEGNVIDGDTVDSAVNCSDRQWMCISIPSLFDFAYDRSWSRPPDAWSFRGVTYRYVGDAELLIGGEDMSGQVICSNSVFRSEIEKTFNACFVFNRRRGIMSFKLFDGEIGGPVWAEYFATRSRGLFSSL